MKSTKMGRPKADNPKKYRFSTTLDLETKEKFEEYCKKRNITQAKAVRDAINQYML